MLFEECYFFVGGWQGVGGLGLGWRGVRSSSINLSECEYVREINFNDMCNLVHSSHICHIFFSLWKG